MRWLFFALIAAFIVGAVFGLGMSIATGLSVKNALLYAIGFTLVFRTALSGNIQVELPAIHILFIAFIGYATLSWIVTFGFIHYPGYHMFSGLITLKTRLIDPALMLLTAFYALRRMEDVRWVLSVLLLGIAAANFATLVDTAGIHSFGMKVGDHGPELGRVFGVFGHANDTGALLVCVIPAMTAMMVTNHGFRRLVWLGCVVASAVVLLLTVSRGAFVGLFVGTVAAAFICRRYVPVSRFVLWGFLALVGVILTLAVASLADPHIGDIVSDRLFSQSKSYDIGDASSGRTQIWAELLSRMARAPISFLTGFGWDVYSVMPFRYAPHNHYLGTWFDLGIIGVMLFVSILATILVTVYRAIPMASEEARPHLLAFMFGMMSLVVAIVFADLFDPWSYIWLYAGMTLRMAVLARQGADQPVAVRITDEPLRVASVAAPAFRDGRSAFGGVLAGRPR